MSKHECHCGHPDAAHIPCPIHQPPLTAFAWESFGPYDACLRRDQYGREVAYATRAGSWTTWFGGGIGDRPDVNLAREKADLNLYENGLLLSSTPCPVPHSQIPTVLR